MLLAADQHTIYRQTLGTAPAQECRQVQAPPLQNYQRILHLTENLHEPGEFLSLRIEDGGWRMEDGDPAPDPLSSIFDPPFSILTWVPSRPRSINSRVISSTFCTKRTCLRYVTLNRGGRATNMCPADALLVDRRTASASADRRRSRAACGCVDRPHRRRSG